MAFGNLRVVACVIAVVCLTCAAQPERRGEGLQGPRDDKALRNEVAAGITTLVHNTARFERSENAWSPLSGSWKRETRGVERVQGMPMDKAGDLLFAFRDKGLEKLETPGLRTLHTRLVALIEDDEAILSDRPPKHARGVDDWSYVRVGTILDLAAKGSAVQSNGIYCKVEVATVDGNKKEVQACDVEYVPEPDASKTEKWPTFDRKSSTTTQMLEAGYYVLRSGKEIDGAYKRGKEKRVWVDQSFQKVDLDAPAK